MAAPASVPPTIKVYYGKPMLPDVSRVLACLYEKAINFQLVDMYDGQYMPAQVLNLQGTAKAPVPALEDGNKLLLESRAICRYVAEKYADKGNMYLLGHDLLERGSIEQWLKAEEQSFNPPSWSLVFHLAFNPETMTTYRNEQDQVQLIQSTQTLATVLDLYEHRLRESEYLAGDEFSLADLTHLPNAHYLANSKEWSYLLNSRKNLWRWWEQISSRPSWQKVASMLDEVGAVKKASSSLQQQPSLFSGSRPPSTTSDLSQSRVSASVESSAPPKESRKVTAEEKSPDATIAHKKNSPEAYKSESNSQSQTQGGSSAGQPASVATESNPAVDAQKSGQQEPAASSAAPGKTDAGTSREDTKQPEALASEPNSQSQSQGHSCTESNPEAGAQKSDQPGSVNSPPAPGKTDVGSSAGPKQAS